MFDIVTTNGAAIMTIIVLWVTITWMVTYVYMGQKVEDLQNRIDVLDWYCHESDREIRQLTKERRETERVYGHVLDDYTEYYLTDKGMEAL